MLNLFHTLHISFRRRLFDPCSDDSDCVSIAAHSSCDVISATCQCATGYFPIINKLNLGDNNNNNNSRNCQEIHLDDPCRTNADCAKFTSGSTCDDVTERCVCNASHVRTSAFDVMCRPRVVGDACTMTSQCQHVTGEAICDFVGRCNCESGNI